MAWSPSRRTDARGRVTAGIDVSSAAGPRRLSGRTSAVRQQSVSSRA
ncbi:hypothetical protein [Nocardioides plantarum]